ncbi:MAG: carbamoyltransferase C-terminal domain-containing protein [Gammaproteobacteria bacterium]
MPKILSIHSGPHDSAAAIFHDYELLAAVQQERLTRKKCDGGFPNAAIDEVLKISGLNKQDIDVIVLSRGSYPTVYMEYGWFDRLRFSVQRKKGRRRHKSIANHMRKLNTENAREVFQKDVFCRENGFSENVTLHFANHHNSHALSALFYLPGENVLAYTSDGGGDGVYYSARLLKGNGELICLYGDDRNFLTQNYTNSLALVYGYATKACGFRMNRHEGKLTGLAAFGEPTLYDEMANHFTVLDTGEVDSDFANNKVMKQEIFRLAKNQPKENVAASVQKLLEVFTLKSIKTLMTAHQVDRLALAGGAFANVRLNKLICEETGVKDIFVFPAMGDDGLVVGGALEYLCLHYGEQDFLSNRRPLANVYLANQYDAEADKLFKQDARLELIAGDPAETAAELIANDKIGAIYTGRMEFGPRALGARSIIASPKDDGINKTLNKRLQRTEFMPFAPYVLEEDAREVFEINDANHYACRFMTITTQVNPKWADKIAAVVHVDGTARPQIVTDADNPLYSSILRHFKKQTGLPVLVNTSFNAHEEPIIYKPEECLRALLDGRVDFLVTQYGVYRRK